jgi:hypothetical protein
VIPTLAPGSPVKVHMAATDDSPSDPSLYEIQQDLAFRTLTHKAAKRRIQEWGSEVSARRLSRLHVPNELSSVDTPTQSTDEDEPFVNTSCDDPPSPTYTDDWDDAMLSLLDYEVAADETPVAENGATAEEHKLRMLLNLAKNVTPLAAKGPGAASRIAGALLR